ncbi:hypothetical protein [Silvanigrella aquatica]|uniref:Uncharacterized protein n=1 Tax=Silvanigrella aquatica TaxID=1915309 RepID=A0A1L4D0Z2_9BACT|nr:hypothetical protein [Silvanigrella aquatica]APJ03875.1 hypothetical protein AXG55_08125 [Silvanigrella aquatica]
MPKMLTISDIQALNRSAFYRFVISESGVIIFGYEDNIMTLSNGKRQNLTSDGIEIAPHSALNNYQPVIAAGKIYYNHEIKKLTELSNYSGHFKPDSSSLVIAKIFFHHQFRELSDHIYLKPYSMKELQTIFPIKLN